MLQSDLGTNAGEGLGLERMAAKDTGEEEKAASSADVGMSEVRVEFDEGGNTIPYAVRQFVVRESVSYRN